jgi:8-oxo-dGTP diphosphatase
MSLKETVSNHETTESRIFPSVQVVFIRQNKSQPEIFLVHRITDSFNEQWCFPGGKKDPGETSPIAACREMKEETGVILETTDLHYLRTTISKTSRQINNKSIIYEYIIDIFTVNANNLSPENASLNEHDEAKWVTFKEALKMHRQAFKKASENNKNLNSDDKIPNALAPKTLETIKMLKKKY